MFRSLVFQGRVKLIRPNPNMNPIWSPIVMNLVLFGLRLLVPDFVPEAEGRVAVVVAMAASAAVFVVLLLRYISPLIEVVDLHVDQRGIFANGTWLMPRDVIREAYIRPAAVAKRMTGVVIPARPLTVELVSTAAPLAIDAGSEGEAQQILHALGFPITVVSPTYVPRKVKRK
jgi:hypothetical protein